MSTDPIDRSIARIERLARLRDTGALSPEEFAAEKARILAGAPAPTSRLATGWWLALAAVLVAVIAGAVLLGRDVVTANAADAVTAERTAARPPLPLPTVTPSPTPTPAAVDLSDDLAFTKVANCEFAPAAERAWKAMLDFDYDTGRPRPLGRVSLGALQLTPRPTVTKADDAVPGGRVYTSEVRFPDDARWQGLPLARLVAEHGSYPETDDYDSRAITFRASPDAVRRTMARLGVIVPVGKYAPLTDEACGGAMEVRPMPGGAALTCSWGC